MKKILSLFFTVVLVWALITAQPVMAAVKISKAKATLEVDATLTLKITGSDSNVTWSSSNKLIASVNSNGVVTAKKEGQATITANIDKKKYTCEVKVVNSNKKTFNEELSAGEYLVGEDIPEGTYNLECLIGAGSVEIYDSEKDYENNSYKYKNITMAAKDSLDYSMFPNLYSPTYKNLKLKKGNYVVIDSLNILFATK